MWNPVTHTLGHFLRIDSILEDLHLQEDSHIKDIPMASSKLLSRHKESEDFDHHFNYRRVVGKLNFLEQSTRGDISYATHMLARFSSCPKVEHGAAVKWLGRCLLGTREPPWTQGQGHHLVP